MRWEPLELEEMISPDLTSKGEMSMSKDIKLKLYSHQRQI